MSKEKITELVDSSIEDPETRKTVDGASGVEQVATLEKSLTFGGQGLLNVRGVIDEKRVAPFLAKYDLTKDAQRYEEIISINPNIYDLTKDAEKFMDRFNMAVKTASYQELKLIGRLDIIQKVKSDSYFEKDITFIETKLNETTYSHSEVQVGVLERSLASGLLGLLNREGDVDEERATPFLTKYDLMKEAKRYNEIVSIDPDYYDLTEDTKKFLWNFDLVVKTAAYQELKLIDRLDVIQKVKAECYSMRDIALIEAQLNEKTQQLQENIPIQKKNLQERHTANQQAELLTNESNGTQYSYLESLLQFGGVGLFDAGKLIDEKNVTFFLTKYDLMKDIQRYERIFFTNSNFDYDNLPEDEEKFMKNFEMAVKTASYQELKLIGCFDIIQKLKVDHYFGYDINVIETKLNENRQQHPHKNRPMKQKNEQEQHAANRQVELLTNALNGASISGGYWLNASSRSLPRIYPTGPAVSPFNSLVLGMHADQNGYKTSLYTLFADAKKRGEAIRERETGAPFLWYRWKEYVNRHNPKDSISREDYLKLPNEEKSLYKGIRNREVQTMFNMDQTTLPFIDKDRYEQSVERYGRYEDRKHPKNEEGKLRIEVNDFALRMRDNLVPIRKSVTGTVYYDSDKNAVYIPEKKHFGQYNDYVQELMRQVVTATGHQQRLAREGMVMKGGVVPSEDAMKYEQLVAELASGVKMMELGLPSKLSNDSLSLVEYWTRELKENPCLIDAIEADVNNAVDIIRRAEEGEKIAFATSRNNQQTIEMKEKQKPQVDSRESAILLDIIRHGGMKIDERNFPSQEVKIAFLEKFSLSHYEKEMNYALEQTTSEDPDVVETAFTEAVDNGARIAEICTEIMPEQWNTKGNYSIADELKKLPDRSTKEMVVVKDNLSGIVDVVIPAGAMGGGVVAMPNGEKRPYRLTPDEVMTADERVAAHAEVRNYNIPRFSKQRIQDALLQEGYRYIRFYNNDGILGYRPDDSYFEGKDVSLNKLNGKSLETVSHFDVSEHVRKAISVLFDRIQMLRDDNNRWILYLKPQNEASFSIYPDKTDINQFFSTIKQGQYEQGEQLRTELAQKYHALATNRPELKIDLFGGSKGNEVDLSKIQRVIIYKTKDERILCAPVIDGIPKVEPREITPQQWQRMWVAEDMAEYKTNLAAKVFKDLLKPIQTVEMEEKSAHTQINLKQYGEIKTKHPDAILLFRNGDSYESYAEDADKVSKFLKFDKAIGLEDGSKNHVDIVSFPSYKLDTVLPELIRAGNRVAICDKVEYKDVIDNEQEVEEVRTSRHL